MKKHFFVFTYLSLFVWLSLSAKSESEKGSVLFSDCSKQVFLELGGVWRKSEKSEEIAESLRRNSLRKSKVEIAFVDLESGASFAVSGMGSLKKFQGKVTRKLFAEMKMQFEAALRKPLPEKARKQIEEYNLRKNGNGEVLTFELLQRIDLEKDSFAIYSLSEGLLDGEKFLVFGAQRHAFINGCVVTINFSFPTDKFTLQEIFDQVWAIGVK